MEVTRENFDDVCPEVLSSLEECDFVAFDMEMTGLSARSEDNPHGMDTFQERWEKTKYTADNIGVLQVGICAFYWGESVDGHPKLHAKPYNFWIFPRAFETTGGQDYRLVIQTSSVEFLSGCGFDFNKSFGQGISYLNATGEKRARELFEKKVADVELSTSDLTQQPIPLDNIRADSKAILAKGLTLTKQLVHGNGKRVAKNQVGQPYVILPRANGFTRRLLYQELPRSHTGLHVGKYSSDNPRDGDFSKWEAVLRVTLVGDDDGYKRAERLRVEEIVKHDRAQLDEAIGFSKIISALKTFQKPLIGHNCLIDLAHLTSKFVDTLPTELETARSFIHETFPMIIDTKYLYQMDSQLSMLCPQHSLGRCYDETSSNSAFKTTNPDIVLGKKFERYQVADGDSNLAHEAGYDAFMTGVIFGRAMCLLEMQGYVYDSASGLWTSKRLTSRKSTKNTIVPQPKLFNKLYLMRVSTCLDLSTKNIEADRNLLLRIANFPTRTKTYHIQKLIQKSLPHVGHVSLTWDNDHSVFFQAASKSDAEVIIQENINARSPEHVGKILNNFVGESRYLRYQDVDVIPFNLWKANNRDDTKVYHTRSDRKRKLMEEEDDEVRVSSKRRKTDRSNCVIS